MYEKVLKLLQDFPEARERRFRSKYFIVALQEKYHEVNWYNFEDVATEYASLIRNWQAVTKDNPTLRGQDYSQGEVLRQEKILSLKYEVGFSHSGKQSKLL